MAANPISHPQFVCSECGQTVDLSSEYCADDSGKTIQVACYVKQIERRHAPSVSDTDDSIQ
jgi:hypothetical protein